MQTIYHKIRGMTDLLRGVPLVAWSIAAFSIGMGAAVAKLGWHELNWLNLSLTIAGGVLFQGVVAHALNELIDWHSGTDRLTVGILSGGTKVLRRGFLTQHDLKISTWLGLIAAFGVTMVLSRRVGFWVWWIFLVGCWASLSYSLPPLRLAYRPLAGEWLAAWPATWTCVYASGMILGAPSNSALMTAASLHATMSVSWLMQHHLADIPADLEAAPQKKTTVAWLSQLIGLANCRFVVAAYFLLTLCVACSLWRGPWVTALPALIALLGIWAALATDPRSVTSVTRWQWVMIALTLANSVVLAMGLATGVW